jgi:predicted alpha/beta hydrolase family esterase
VRPVVAAAVALVLVAGGLGVAVALRARSERVARDVLGEQAVAGDGMASRCASTTRRGIPARPTVRARPRRRAAP